MGLLQVSQASIGEAVERSFLFLPLRQLYLACHNFPQVFFAEKLFLWCFLLRLPTIAGRRQWIRYEVADGFSSTIHGHRRTLAASDRRIFLLLLLTPL